MSAHPAFPAIVALWFAALFGLGSLIVPVQLVERLIGMTGIAALVPAAAPPLGFTARAAIALGATIAGALIGFFAARKVGKAKASNDKARRLEHSPVDSERLPLNPETDLEDEGIDAEINYADEDEERGVAPKFVPGRRRALAIEEESGPSEFLNLAPLPGEFQNRDEDGDEDEDALYLDPSAELPADVEESEMIEEPRQRQEFIPATENEEAHEGAVDDTPAPFAMPAVAGEVEAPLPFSPPSLSRAEQADGSRPFDAPQNFPQEQPQALADPLGEENPDEDPVPDESNLDALANAADTCVTEEERNPHAQQDASEAGAAEQGDGGLVQLVQKLGHTIEKHREWSARRAAEAEAAAIAVVETTSEASPPVPQDFDPAEADDVAQARANFFAPRQSEENPAEESGDPSSPADQDHPSNPAPVVGEAYAPFAGAMRVAGEADEAMDDEEEDDVADLAASFSLPLTSAHVRATPTPRPSFDIAPAPASSPPPVERANGEEERLPGGEARDTDYESLSKIANPFKRNAEDFVRIDEPEPEPDATQPAVQFPSEQTRPASPAPSGARPFDPPAAAASGPSEESAPPRDASNDDHERALREALINLQRMSK